MDTRHWRAACGAAAWLVCLAAPVRPAAAQILESLATGQILAGQSTSDSASTTVVFLGDVLPGAPTNTLTTRVGFNVNADAAPGLVAIEVALLSFDIRFEVAHTASFDLNFDFLLAGRLQRVADQECVGSMILGDIAIPKLVRLSDGAEFPLGANLPGAALALDGTTTGIGFAEQDERSVSFRGEPVGVTDYQLIVPVSATAISQSCEVSARFGADNGSTTECDACVYPGFGNRVRDDDGLFVTLTVDSLCGNVRLDPGEQCDFGPENGLPEACCDAFCRFAPAGQTCRAAAGECDQPEACLGDVAGCPDDVKQAAGSPCTADDSQCTADACDAGGTCTHLLRPGTTCDENDRCICDHDGLFCTSPAQCPLVGSLCITTAPFTPCDEDDICDEERDLCLAPDGTPRPTATSSPTATQVTTSAPTATPPDASPTPGCADRHPTRRQSDAASADRHPNRSQCDPRRADRDADRARRGVHRRLRRRPHGGRQRARARRQHPARYSTRFRLPRLRRRRQRQRGRQRAGRRRGQRPGRLPDVAQRLCPDPDRHRSESLRGLRRGSRSGRCSPPR